MGNGAPRKAPREGPEPQGLALLLPGRVTLGQLLNFPGPRFPHQYSGDKNSLPQRVVRKMKLKNVLFTSCLLQCLPCSKC